MADSTATVVAEPEPGTARHRYEQHRIERQLFLERGRSVARITIPHLYPEDSHNSSTSFQIPYQGVGARGVNNLASKLLLSLLPPSTPFFKLDVDDRSKRDAPEGSDVITKIEKQLDELERAIMQNIEAEGIRTPLYHAFRLLIVGGNALLYLPNEGGMRTFHLEDYSVKRDPMGNAFEIITRELVAMELIPKNLQQVVRSHHIQKFNNDTTVEVYTMVKLVRNGRRKGRWMSHQELADGTIVPKTEASFPEDSPPWIPLTWTRIPGEDYGRGLGEEQFGDLKSLELLAAAIVKGSLAAAKVIFLVDPAGITDMDDIAEKQSTSVVPGNEGDVSVVQMNKHADFSVARNMAEALERRLERVFLFNSTVQRKGERVTAEEIRFVARELEETLGGIFSLFTKELQDPILKRTMGRMRRSRLIGPIPKGVNPTIITGLEALRRGAEIEKLDTFVDLLLKGLGQDGVKEILEPLDYADRIATGLSLNTKGLIKTKEALAQASTAAAVQGLVQTLGKPAIDSITKQQLQANDLEAQAAPDQG